MIIRDPHTDRFTVVANAALEDPRLSNAAKGLLVRMLSMSESWTFSVAGLAAVCKDGNNAVRRQLTELEACGYLRRWQSHNDGGTFSSVKYLILESPQTDLPQADLPQADLPQAENRTQTNKNPTKNNPTRKNSTKTSSSFFYDEGRTAEEIAERLEFDLLAYQYDAGQLRAIAQLMAEVERRTAPLRINGQQMPAAEVRRQFRSLEDDHICYVLDRMEESQAEIRDMRGWLLTALYNAPLTIDAYYAARVAFDNCSGVCYTGKRRKNEGGYAG